MQARGKPHRWFLSPGGKATGFILLALCTPISFAQSAEVRTWTDITGQYETRAKFLGFSDGQVRLQKEDGTEITLPLARLSQKDQTFVKEQADDAPQGRSSGWKLLRNTSTGEEQISTVLGSVRVAGRRKLQVQEQKTGSKTWIWADEWEISDLADGGFDSRVSAPSSSSAGGELQASLAPSDSRRPVASPRVAQVLAIGSGTDFSQAEKNALAQALERTIGVMVDAETIVRDDQVVRDEILTYTKGYIQEYSVLRSWQQDGITHVEVFARVSVSKLTEKLKTKAASEQELDGRLMQVQVELEQQYERNARDMFRKVVEDFTPQKILRPAVVEKPEMERASTAVKLIVPYTVTADLNAWEGIYLGMKPLLKRISISSKTDVFSRKTPTTQVFDRKRFEDTPSSHVLIFFYAGRPPTGEKIFLDGYLLPNWLKPEIAALVHCHNAQHLTIKLLDEGGDLITEARASALNGEASSFLLNRSWYCDFIAPLSHDSWEKAFPLWSPGVTAPCCLGCPDHCRGGCPLGEKKIAPFSKRWERAVTNEFTATFRITLEQLGRLKRCAVTWTQEQEETGTTRNLPHSNHPFILP